MRASQSLPARFALPALALQCLFLLGCGSQKKMAEAEIPNLWSAELEGVRVDYVDLNSNLGQSWKAIGTDIEGGLKVDCWQRSNFVAGDPEAGAMVNLQTRTISPDNPDWLKSAFPGLEVTQVEATPVWWGWQEHDGVRVSGTLNEAPFEAELAETIPGIGLARYALTADGQVHAFELAAIAEEVVRDAGNDWVYHGDRTRVLFEDRETWPLLRLVNDLMNGERVDLPIRLRSGNDEQQEIVLMWGPQGQLLKEFGSLGRLDFDPRTGLDSEEPLPIVGIRVAKQPEGFDRSDRKLQAEVWLASPEEPETAQRNLYLQVLRTEDPLEFEIVDWQIEQRDADPLNVLDQLYVEAAEERIRQYYERFFEADQAITDANFRELHEHASERLVKMPEPTEAPHYETFEFNPMTLFPKATATSFEIGQGQIAEKEFYRRNGTWRRVLQVPVTVQSGDEQEKLLVQLVSSNGSRNTEYWLPMIDDFQPADDPEAPSYLDQLR